MAKSRPILTLSSVLLVACGGADSPFAPPPISPDASLVTSTDDADPAAGDASVAVSASEVTAPTALVLPGVELDPTAWLSGAFSFAAPLTSIATTGAFDPDLLADLAVDVCAVGSCGQQSLGTYTAQTGPGSERIRLDSDDEHFIVNWHTDEFDLSSGPYFLLRVLARGLEIGSVEVQIVNNGSQLKDANTGSSIGLLDGRTLPVKFAVMSNPLIRAWVAAATGGTSVDVARLLAGDFSLDAASIAELLALSGFDATEVATALADQGLGAQTIAELLVDTGLVTGPEGAIIALLAVGATTSEVAAALRDEFSLTAGQAAAALYAAGVSAADAGTAIRTAFALDLPGTIQALKDGLFPGGDVGTWALSEPETPTVETVTGLLATAGFPIDDVGTWSSDNLLELFLILQIMDPNYGQTESAEWLWGHLAGAVDETAAVMRDAGRSAGEVVDFLMNSKNQIFDVVAAATHSAGYTALEAAGAFRQFAGVKVHAMAGKLGTLWGLTKSKITGAVRNAGYRAGEVADWALTTSAGVVHDAMQLLKDGGYAVGEAVTGFVGGTQAALEDVGQGAVDIFNATTADWADPMKQVLDGMKSQSEVARDLHDTMIAIILNIAPGTSNEDAAATAVGDLSSLGFDPMDVGNWTADRIVSLAVTLQIMDPNYGQTDTFDWLWARVGGVAADAADAMANAQYKAGVVVDFLMNSKNQVFDVVAAAVHAAGYAATDAALAFRERVGAKAGAVADKLVTYWGLTTSKAVGIMRTTGYFVGDVANWALQKSGGVVRRAMEFMKDGGYAVREAVTGFVAGTQAALEDVGQAAVDLFNATTLEWADPMKQVLDAMKSQSEVTRDLHDTAIAIILNLAPGTSTPNAASLAVADLSSLGFDPLDVGNWTADEILSLALTLQIMDPNYGQTEAFDWLWSRVGGVASDAVDAMAQAQYSATEVVQYVMGEKNQVVDAVMKMLNASGYAATAVASAMWLEGGASSTQLAVGLDAYWSSTPLEIVQIFQALTMPLGDIVTALLNGLQLTTIEVTNLLVQVGFALADILALLP